MAKIPYASTVGGLMYDMVDTCYDISFFVGVVSRQTMAKKHWEEIKSNYEIPQRHKEFVHIRFGKQKASVVRFTDANYVGHAECRKSTAGYVFTFTRAVSWISRLQRHVALYITLY